MRRVAVLCLCAAFRTFLSVQLGVNETKLRQYVETIDKALAQFKLPAYYEVRRHNHRHMRNVSLLRP